MKLLNVFFIGTVYAMSNQFILATAMAHSAQLLKIHRISGHGMVAASYWLLDAPATLNNSNIKYMH